MWRHVCVCSQECEIWTWTHVRFFCHALCWKETLLFPFCILILHKSRKPNSSLKKTIMEETYFHTFQKQAWLQSIHLNPNQFVSASTENVWCFSRLQYSVPSIFCYSCQSLIVWNLSAIRTVCFSFLLSALFMNLSQEEKVGITSDLIKAVLHLRLFTKMPVNTV